MVKDKDYLCLVREARAGNRDSMNQLAVRIQERLYPYLYRVTLDYNLSQDLLQEILLTMVSCLKGLEKADCFWSWIYRIAQRKLQQHFRVQKRRENFRCFLSDEGVLEQLKDKHNVLAIVIRREKSNSLSAAIEQLKERYKDVVQLRCFEQMSYKRIASLTHCSCQQVRLRFFRAKESLRNKLCVSGLEEA